MYPTGNDTIDTGGLPIIPPKKGKSLDTGGLPILKKKEVGGVPSQVGGEVGTSVHQSEPDVHKLKNLSDLRGVSPQQQQEIKDYIVSTDKEHKTKVNDAINSTTDFYKAAIKLYTGKENEFQNDVPEEQKGEHVSKFLKDPNVIERTKTDPEFAKHYKEAKFNWINDFPEAAKKDITQKIGQHLEDKHKTGILFNNPGKPKVDEAVNELASSGEFDQHEVYKYNQDIRPHVGTTKSLLFGSPIPTADYVNTISKSLVRSGGNIVEGMRDAADKLSFGTISRFGESRAAHQERILNDIHSEPQVESKASAANKVGLNIADMVGFVLPAVLGEFAGVPTMATLGTQFYGQNKKEGMDLYPDNENKQDAYAALTTGIDLVVGEKLPIKGLGESIRGLVDDAAVGTIAKDAAKNKYLGFINDVLKGTVSGTNALEAMKVGHNAANAVFGGRNFNLEDEATQVLKDYPQDALGMAFFSGIHAATKAAGTEAPKIEATPIEAAKEAAKDMPDTYRQHFIDNTEQSLKEVSEQLHDPKSEEVTRKTFGDKISDIALQLHPKEKITPQQTTTETVQYHGGKKSLKQDELKGVMYFTGDKDFAEGYSKYRHSQEKPQITEGSIKINNPAPYSVVKEVSEKLGYDFDSDSPASFIEKKGVVEELKKIGYDGAILNDFGFRNDFEEVPVSIVFDADKQVKINPQTTTETVPKELEETPSGKSPQSTTQEVSDKVKELQSKRDQLINQRDNPPKRNVIETNDEGEVTGKVIQKPLKQKDIEIHVAERNKEIEAVDAQIEKIKLAEKTKPKLEDLPFLKADEFEKARNSDHMDDLVVQQKAVKQKFKNLRKISECIWAI